jgi:hypothetical protein
MSDDARTNREEEAPVGESDAPTRPADGADDYGPGWNDPPADGGWWNPPYEVRIVLVGAVWAMPGVLFALLVSLFLPFPCDPAVAAAVGAVGGGFVGGWFEAVG